MPKKCVVPVLVVLVVALPMWNHLPSYDADDAAADDSIPQSVPMLLVPFYIYYVCSVLLS